MYSIIMLMVTLLPWHSADRRLSGGRMEERGEKGVTDSHTENLSSSQAEIRTHANGSADADRLYVFASVYLDVRHC